MAGNILCLLTWQAIFFCPHQNTLPCVVSELSWPRKKPVQDWMVEMKPGPLLFEGTWHSDIGTVNQKCPWTPVVFLLLKIWGHLVFLIAGPVNPQWPHAHHQAQAQGDTSFLRRGSYYRSSTSSPFMAQLDVQRVFASRIFLQALTCPCAPVFQTETKQDPVGLLGPEAFLCPPFLVCRE